MAVYVHHIATRVPEYAYSQAFIGKQMACWAGTERDRKLIQRVYQNSGIETRYSVLDDFHPGAANPLFRNGADGRPSAPTTAARNARFVQEAHRLAVAVARDAIEHAPGFTPADITHVITVTCTGFANPGLDSFVTQELNLHPDVQRYALGFMGCYAALPALRMAEQFCRADSASVVLVVAVELCTLHLHLDAGMDALIANVLFADGAAAALVTARQPAAQCPALTLDGFASALIPQGEADMAWSIGDHGFDLKLSAYVPNILGATLPALSAAMLRKHQLAHADIDLWAVHPGGKAILDKVESELELRPEQVAASRSILRRYGNMSSVTCLFVLQDLLAAHTEAVGRRRILAMAFGPGLTVETAVLGLLSR